MKKLIALIAICLSATPAFAFGHRSIITNAWYQAYLGGGGETVRADWANPSVRLMSGDANLCYIYSKTWGQWYAIPNLTAFASINANNTSALGVGFNPHTGGSQLYSQNQVSDGGCYEIRGAPGMPSVAYVFWQFDLYVSTNIDPDNPQNITWSSTGLHSAGVGGINLLSPQAGNGKAAGPALAVDPFNPDHVVMGTYTQGLWETLNGRNPGGASWTQINTATGIATLNTGTNPAYTIAFDSSAGSQGGIAKRAYISVQGTGVYVADNIGSAGSFNSATWNLTNGGTGSMPTNTIQLVVNPGGNGNNAGKVYQISGTGSAGANGTLNTYVPGALGSSQNGTWATPGTIPAGSANHVGVNPNDGNYVAVTNGAAQTIYSSTDSGSTFSSNSASAMATEPNGPGWLTAIGTNVFLTNTFVLFDPTSGAPGNLWIGGGQGMWTTPLPSGSFTLTTFSKGTHQLASGTLNWGGHTSSGQIRMMMSAQDEQGCTFILPTNNYPTTCFKVANAVTLGATYKQSVTPDGTIQAATFGQNSASVTPNLSGTSIDGFINDWRPINNGWLHQNVAASQIVTNAGSAQLTGLSAPDTSSLTSWSAGTGDFLCGLNNGRPFPNSVSTGVVWNTPTTMQCYPFHVDSSSALTFNISGQSIAYTSNMSSPLWANGFTFWKLPTSFLTNAAGAWTVLNVTNNGSGLVRLTLAGIPSGTSGCCTLVANDPIFVSGVTMSGVGTPSTVNGLWRISAASAFGFPMTVDLLGSTFGTDSYVTGGTAAGVMATSGAQLDVADANHMVYLPGSGSVGATDGNALPKCTQDGGKTWVDLSIFTPALTTVNGSFGAGSTAITVLSGAAVPTANYIVQLDSGRLMKTSVTTSGNIMTMTNAVPPGDGLTTSNPIYSISAIVVSAGTAFQVLSHDWVTPDTFYLYDTRTNGGMWQINSSCVPTKVAGLASVNRTGNPAYIMKSVVGEAGHLIFFPSPNNMVSNQAQPAASSIGRSCDGGVTWWAMPNMWGANSGATGAPVGGNSYPAIYVQGWYDADQTNNTTDTHNIFSLWRMVDDPNHGINGHCVVGGVGTGGTSGSASQTITVSTFTTTGTTAGNLGIGASLVSPTAGVPAGTKIDGMQGSGVACSPSACTGSGAAGTYHLNNSVTIAGTSTALVFQAGTWVNLCPSGAINSLQGTSATQCWPGNIAPGPTDVMADPWVPGFVGVLTKSGAFFGAFN